MSKRTELPENFNISKVVIDFLAKGKSDDEWLVVFVEEGRIDKVDEFLYALQKKFYDCLDAILDGALAEKFPQTKGGRIVIRLDGYDLPEEQVREFFLAFSNGALETEDYRAALNDNQFVREIGFELNLSEL